MACIHCDNGVLFEGTALAFDCPDCTRTYARISGLERVEFESKTESARRCANSPGHGSRSAP